MNFYKDKNVLVTGGTGLIGIPLVQKLVRLGADVHIVSADGLERFEKLQEKIPEFKFVKGEGGVTYECADLEDYGFCEESTIGMDYVFQLAGSKGGAGIGTSKAATFLSSHLLINLNMLKAAKKNNVKKYLLTSTVGVYPPNSSYKEDDVWKGDPSEGDKYSAWAKRISELAAEAYMKEYGWEGIVIVRPGSVYGPWDNFDKDTAMVVGSLINKFDNKEEKVHIYGDGDPIRDFTYSEDIADGMLLALEKSGNCETFNLSIGKGYSIKYLINEIRRSFSFKEAIFDGPLSLSNKRVLDIYKAEKVLGFKPKVELREGIEKTIKWYLKNKKIAKDRYNAFK